MKKFIYMLMCLNISCSFLSCATNTVLYDIKTGRSSIKKGSMVLAEKGHIATQDRFHIYVYDGQGKQIDDFSLGRKESVYAIEEGGFTIVEDNNNFYVRAPKVRRPIYTINKERLKAKDVKVSKNGELATLDDSGMLRIFFQRGHSVKEPNVLSIAINKELNKLYALKSTSVQEFDLRTRHWKRLRINARGKEKISFTGNQIILS